MKTKIKKPVVQQLNPKPNQQPKLINEIVVYFN